MIDLSFFLGVLTLPPIFRLLIGFLPALFLGIAIVPEVAAVPLEDALDKLAENKVLKEAFGEDVINSYLKLKKQEIDEFNKDEVFDKRKDITYWERKNTLDC